MQKVVLSYDCVAGEGEMINTATAAYSLENLASEGGSVSPFPARPFQLVTLLDMLQFDAGTFVKSFRELTWLINEFGLSIEKEGGASLISEHKNLGDLVRLQMDRLLVEVTKYPLKETVKAINRLRFVGLAPFAKRYTLLVVHDRLLAVRESMQQDCKDYLFLFVPTTEAEYYEQSTLFDDETKPLEERVSRRFPKANKEITAAGNCYATGNYTACVFHLMRAVERGVRALAKDLKLRVGKGKDCLPHPVELCDWGTLARVFREKIDQLPTRKSMKASKLISFYNDSIAHFAAIKDIRNRICHSRQRAYSQYEARSVLDNAEHFMKQIATRLTEQPEEADNSLPEN